MPRKTDPTQVIAKLKCVGRKTVDLSNSKANNTVPLFLLALLAVLVIWLATRFGIGISPDSTVYMNAASNLLNGRGLIALTARGDFQPLTHYPPLYPAVLALFVRVGFLLGGIPIETVARVLNSLLFGTNVLLVGIAIRSYARNSYWLPILGGLLTFTAADIAGLHTFALSEGLFILLSLCGFVLLGRFIMSERIPWLICSAALVALAFLTRYVGVTLVFTGVLVLLCLNGRAFRKRFFDALTFGVIACAPMALWAFRNMRISAAVSDRELVFHPTSLKQIVTGLSTVSTWLLVGKVRTDYRVVVFIVEIAAASLFVIYLLRLSRKAAVNKDHSDDAATDEEWQLSTRRETSPVAIIFLVFIVCYVAFLIFTSSFIDADMVLDHRALAPVHVAAIVLACCFASKLLRPFSHNKPIRIAFAALAMILLGSYSLRSALWLKHARQDGQGYASRVWKESETIAYVKTIPAGAPIYSNGFDAIYYLSGRPAIYLPERVIHGTGRENQNYAAEVEGMRRTLIESGGLLVYFNSLPERWFLPSETDLKTRLPLATIVTARDGSIFKLYPNNEGPPDP